MPKCKAKFKNPYSTFLLRSSEIQRNLVSSVKKVDVLLTTIFKKSYSVGIFSFNV